MRFLLGIVICIFFVYKFSECKMLNLIIKHIFTFCLFKQRKMNKQNNTKPVLYLLKPLFTCLEVKEQIKPISRSPCYFHLGSLEGDIRKVPKIVTYRN